MKKFNEIRESQKTVVNKKLMGVPVKISSSKSKGKTSFKFFLNSLQSYGINESADVDFKK